MLVLQLIFLTFCTEQVTPAVIHYFNYTVANAVPFKGNNATLISPLCEVFFEQTLECLQGSKLDDDNTGGTVGLPLAADNIAYEDFFAFSRNSQGSDGIIQFNFPTYYSDDVNIILHFINNPDQAIGLPSISIETLDSTLLPYGFDNNFDLQLHDTTIRNVSLNVRLPIEIDSINGLQIEIKFPSNNMNNWFLLSEVDIFDSDFIIFQEREFRSIILGPDKVESSTRFTCTVINSGSYDWSWEHDDERIELDNRHMFWVAAATRSGQLEINQLRYSDGGNYSCIVRSTFSNTNIHRRTLQLTLKAEIKISSIVSFAPNTTASVACELYGYLPGEIEWRRNGEVIQPEGIYSFTKSSGDIDSISVSGISVRSQILTLNIANFNESSAGEYSCVVLAVDTEQNVQKIVTLSLGDPEPIVGRQCTNYDSLNILIGVNIGSALLQIIVNILHDECRNRNWKKSTEKLKNKAKKQPKETRKKRKLVRADAVDNGIGENRRRPPLQRTNTFDLGKEEQEIGGGNSITNHSSSYRRGLGFVGRSQGLEELMDPTTMAAAGVLAGTAAGMGIAQTRNSSNDDDSDEEVDKGGGHLSTSTTLSTIVGHGNIQVHPPPHPGSTHSLTIPRVTKQESDDINSGGEDDSLLPKSAHMKGQSSPKSSQSIGQKLTPSWFKKKVPVEVEEIDYTMGHMLSDTMNRLPFPTGHFGNDDKEMDSNEPSTAVPSSVPFSEELNKIVDKAKDLAPKFSPSAAAGQLGPLSGIIPKMGGNNRSPSPGGSTDRLKGIMNEEDISLPTRFDTSGITDKLNPTWRLNEKIDQLGHKASEMMHKIQPSSLPAIGELPFNDGAESNRDDDTHEDKEFTNDTQGLPFVHKMVDKAKEFTPKLSAPMSMFNKGSARDLVDSSGPLPLSTSGVDDALGGISQKLNPAWLKAKADDLGHELKDIMGKGKDIPAHLVSSGAGVFNSDKEENQVYEEDSATGSHLPSAMPFGKELDKMIDKAKEMAPKLVPAGIFDRPELSEIAGKVTNHGLSLPVPPSNDDATETPSTEKHYPSLPKFDTSAISSNLTPTWLKDKVDGIGEVQSKVKGILDDGIEGEEEEEPHGSRMNLSSLPFHKELGKMAEKAKEVVPKLEKAINDPPLPSFNDGAEKLIEGIKQFNPSSTAMPSSVDAMGTRLFNPLSMIDQPSTPDNVQGSDTKDEEVKNDREVSPEHEQLDEEQTVDPQSLEGDNISEGTTEPSDLKDTPSASEGIEPSDLKPTASPPIQTIPSISITSDEPDDDEEQPVKQRTPLRSLKITESKKPKLNQMMKSFHLEEEDLDTVQANLEQKM